MKPEVEGHMSEDYRWKEIERRMDRVERATEQVPLIARDVADLKTDISEVKDDARSIRRALYTAAISVAGSALVFLYGVTELFK